MSLKKFIWKVTPKPIHGFLRNVFFSIRLLPSAYYDYRRYLIHSGINKSRGYRREQAARITMAYHQIEKGLSLAEPRPGFGKDAVLRLLEAIERFIGHHGVVAPASTAISVLGKYIEFNEASGIDMSWLKARIAVYTAGGAVVEQQCGGTIRVRRTEIDRLRQSDFASFFKSRYSVRHFSGGIIPEGDLTEAVAIAQKTPSVCNRQAWKVHAYSDQAVMTRLLEIQAGSRGFGHQASMLLIVTCDLSSFVEIAERYQAWIDGGMFCMSLCLAFHALGYGTCCLNWSKEPEDDIRLRRATSIDEQEQIVMMIAVGTLPDEFSVAVSPRHRLEDVLQVH